MDIFGVLNMVCGLALFLYGMHVMGDGLTRISGGKLESILEKLTQNKIKAVLLGALVTAVIQSSSATTVMVVGFVNSGIMKLTQAAGRPGKRPAPRYQWCRDDEPPCGERGDRPSPDAEPGPG